MQLGDDALVARFVQQLHAGQREAGQEHDHRHIAEDDALDQIHAQVRADLEAHEHQRHEAEHRGGGGGGDGGEALLDGRAHGHFHVVHLLPVALEAVQQEDGIVQRDGQLHDGAHRLRDEGDLPEHDVGAHVDEDGHADAGQEEQRRHPGGGGEYQQQHDDGHGDGRGAQHLRHHALLYVGGVGGVAADGAVLADELIERVDGAALAPVGHRHLIEGRAVAPVLLDGGLVHQLHRRGEVLHVVQPHDARHAVHSGDVGLQRLRLREREAADHHARVRDAGAELVVEDAKRDGALGVRRQVVRQLVVHAHAQHQHGADERERQEYGDHRPPVGGDGLRQSVHGHAP